MKSTKKFKITIITLSVLCALLIAGVVVLLCILLSDPYDTISKEEFYEAVGNNLKIPVVEINTSGSDPSSDTNYASCSFALSNTAEPTHSFSVEMKDNPMGVGGVGIRVRGNYSQNAEKKAYRVRFNEKTSILGLKANKSWVLLADAFDQSNIRNYTALTLASYFDNMDFTPTPNHVALIMNGEFRGLYLLCEQVDEENGRCDVEVDDLTLYKNDYPFLVCVDESSKSGQVKGRDYFEVEGWYPVEIKYPDYDERPLDGDPVFNYIEEYMNAVYSALKTGEKVTVSFSDTPLGLEDLVDIDSLIDYYLVNEIMFNCDSASKSIYAYREAGGKLKFGPVWDFDWSMAYEFDLPYSESHIGTAYEIHIQFRSPLFEEFLKNEEYMEKTALRFLEKKDALLAVSEHLRTYKNKIDGVATIDATITYGENGIFQYDMQYDYVRLYLLDRYNFLVSHFTSILGGTNG